MFFSLLLFGKGAGFVGACGAHVEPSLFFLVICTFFLNRMIIRGVLNLYDQPALLFYRAQLSKELLSSLKNL